MSNPLSSNAGKPSLNHLQYLQDHWAKADIDNALLCETVNITSSLSGTSGVEAAGIPEGATIVDVVVHTTTTVGSGSAQVKVGGGGAAISDAIAMATADAVARASTIDQTYKIVGEDGIEVVTNSDSDEGDVYIYYKK